MPILNRRPIARRPIHPGEILREEFLPASALTVASLATALGVSRQSVNELLRERRAVSPEMALRLARLLGTTPQYWMDLQRNVDLWDARQSLRSALGTIRPLRSVRD
jgi:addiction module HigA family antidote